MPNPSTARASRGTLLARRYRLLRQIGEGAMGIVWAATDEVTTREVALKLLVRSEPELRQRLLREARACGALRHRNIISIFDVAELDEGEPFLVMELLTGETVAELLERRRRLNPELAAWIGRDVAKALDAAHALRIIHRDLKPANIFLHQEPNIEGYMVKVLDFGISKHLGVSDGLHTVAGGTVGSPFYMSPEQVRGDAGVDHRADIWALGVVLFEMLTGVRPFQGETSEVFAKLLNGEIPSVTRYVRRIDERIAQVVDRCLVRDRGARISSAAEVAALLDPFAGAISDGGSSSPVWTGGTATSTPSASPPGPVDAPREPYGLRPPLPGAWSPPSSEPTSPPVPDAHGYSAPTGYGNGAPLGYGPNHAAGPSYAPPDASASLGGDNHPPPPVPLAAAPGSSLTALDRGLDGSPLMSGPPLAPAGELPEPPRRYPRALSALLIGLVVALGAIGVRLVMVFSGFNAPAPMASNAPDATAAPTPLVALASAKPAASAPAEPEPAASASAEPAVSASAQSVALASAQSVALASAQSVAPLPSTTPTPRPPSPTTTGPRSVASPRPPTTASKRDCKTLKLLERQKCERGG